MEAKRGCDHSQTVEMAAVPRNDCDELSRGQDRKQIPGIVDKESLVLPNGNVEVEVKADGKNTLRTILVSFIVLLLLAICIVVVVWLVRTDKDKTDKKHDKTCNSPDCIISAARLINGANFSADPCTDFYKYACGGWKKRNFLPESQSEWNGFTSLRHSIASIMKRALDSKLDSRKVGKAVKKLFSFYHSCTNESQLNALGAAPLQGVLGELGSWPLLNDSWSEKGWNFEDATFAYHSLFFSYYHHGRPAPIFNSYVKVDDKNASKHVISVDQPAFLLIPKNFMKEPTRWKQIYSSYEVMVREYVKLLGGNASTTQINDVLNFEMTLANASIPIGEFRNVVLSYKSQTMKEFIEMVGSQIDWKRYLTKTFARQKVKIDNSTMIGSRSINYLKKVNTILSTTPKRTVANYLGWVTVYKYGTHLSKAFRNADLVFRRVLLGVKKDTDHWFKCFETVEDNLDMPVARIYSQLNVLEKAKKDAKTVIEGVKDTFVKRIQELDWMDKATKGKANKKGKLMIYDIGFPEFINDETKLDAVYETLDIGDGRYLQNLINSYKWRRNNNLGLIDQPVNKRVWDLPPTQVNAYYDVSNNKMVFLAGIMGNPFFDSKGPKSLLYGSFGFVAGHEITHGFDDQGRRYDPNGDLKNWWSAGSTDAFKSKTSCIEKQYSAYKYKGINANGNMSLGENIADIGGLKIAHSAYMRWLKENGEEASLPGIKLSNQQLFFLSFGQIWCALYNEQRGKQSMKNDVHSLPDFRVIGPLSNSVEFARAFNCPANAPMMRKNKCEMW